MTTRMVVVALLLAALASPCLASSGEKSLLFEGFESVTPPMAPAGWAVFNPAGDPGTWESRGYGGVKWGVQCMRYRSSPAQNADDWLFTPAVQLPGGVPCRVGFMTRTGASGPPLNLEVFAGPAPTPASMLHVVGALHPVNWTAHAADSGTFTPPTSGTYCIGFHVVGPPASARLDLDEVDVTIPETGLRISLGMSHELDLLPLVFSPDDTIETCVYVENTGADSPVFNQRFSVGRWPSSAELDFHVTGPTGPLPVITMFAKSGEAKGSDFAALAPQQVVGKALNLWSWFRFDVPGSYAIEVRYRNYSDPAGLGAWKGKLVSDPIVISIE